MSRDPDIVFRFVKVTGYRAESCYIPLSITFAGERRSLRDIYVRTWFRQTIVDSTVTWHMIVGDK